jgi:hypothetical protein
MQGRGRPQTVVTPRPATAKLGVAGPPAVDKRRLSADDYEQYQTFVSRWNRPPTFRDLPGFAVATAIFFVVCGGGFFVILLWDIGSTLEQEYRSVGVAFALYFAGLVPWLWFAWYSARRRRIRLSAEARLFLEERLRDAPSPERDDDDPGNPYFWTGNYDPGRYYRSVDGMSREDREYTFGAYEDLDTYESNRPD